MREPVRIPLHLVEPTRRGGGPGIEGRVRRRAAQRQGERLAAHEGTGGLRVERGAAE
jgi:hypothetical protein